MQRPRNGCANETEAGPVSGASSYAGREVHSPIDLAKAVQIKRISEVFDIHPDPITTSDVLHEKSALACFIDGFLLNDETALGLGTHRRSEQWGGDVGETLFLNPMQVAHLQRRLHSFQQLTPLPWAADVPIKIDYLVPTTTVGVV